MGNLDPEEYFQIQIQKSFRADKKKRLTLLNEILREESLKEIRDFSLRSIGRICQEKGVMNCRTLYTSQSVDYRNLIEIWELCYRSNRSKVISETDVLDFCMGIEDPAIRSLIQILTVENNRLMSEINNLKSLTNVTIDRRQLGGSSLDTLGVKSGPILTGQEISSIRDIVNPRWLELRGWTEGSSGEVINDSGRLVFDIAFMDAIRRVLEYIDE